jgi:hypothetical protein
MQIEITRDELLLAIKHESLCAEIFERPLADGSCHRCAVGAVLSRKLKDHVPNLNQTARALLLEGGMTDLDSLPVAIKNEQWLSAVSIKFEQMATKLADDRSKWADELSPEELQELKPALTEWTLCTIPDGVIFRGEI